MTGDDFKFYLFLISIFGASLLSIKRGLLWLKRKRIIEDTPTSKIDTAAIGSFTEVVGRCINHCEKRLVAPLSSEGCSAYILKIEKLVHRGKKEYWENIADFYSDEYLFIDDRSRGVATMKTCDLELENWDKTTVIKTKSLFNKPTSTLDNLKRKYSRLKAVLSDSNQYRLTEFKIARNKKMYVLATSTPFISFTKGLKMKKGGIELITGNESGFHHDSEIKNRVKFQFARLDQKGLLLKLDKVYFSNFTEKELLRRKGFWAFIFISLGVIGATGVVLIFLYEFGAFRI